jgi:hypothetical protein
MNSEERDSIVHTRQMELKTVANNRNYIRHNAKSVELIQYSAERGMSRAAMNRIWSEQLINAVLGYGEMK